MQRTLQQQGITFQVDRVEPATEPLRVTPTHEQIYRILNSKFESCSDYQGEVILHLRDHPLLEAVQTAFSQHRPLVLTPDAVWITITQGVAHHMALHGERLRARFVADQDKLNLVVTIDNWVDGSPHNPWPQAFAGWAEQIRDHVGADLHDTLVCDFSTSGPVERSVSQLVMMDIFERYFHYVLHSICGIPSVTLTGTPADWQRLADKAARLRVFDLDWWLEYLLPICEQFGRASRGDVDLEHWQNICKRKESYGGDIINGWVAELFPYLRTFRGGPCTRRNPIFENGQGFQSSDVPAGLSRVPFTRYDRQGQRHAIEAIGGLVGVAQDGQTLALQPKVAWAVREAEKMDRLLMLLAETHTTCPGIRIIGATELPADMAKFYHFSNGASLLSQGVERCRMVVMADIEALAWARLVEGYPVRAHKLEGNGPRWRGYVWHRFIWLADGSWLAINIDPEGFRLRLKGHKARPSNPPYAPIYYDDPKQEHQPGAQPVIAASFTELLERLLANGGEPYWLDPNFVSYGEAELVTRRE